MKRKFSFAAVIAVIAVLVALPALGLAAARATGFGQQAMLQASNGAIRDSFGHSVALAGGTVVVGAEFHKVGTHASQGEAYVYVQPRSRWANATETAKLVASDGRPGDLFGEVVAVSGNTIVAGAYPHRVGNHAEQGKVYVFVKPRSGWAGTLRQTGALISSNGAAGDWFGSSVASRARPSSPAHPCTPSAAASARARRTCSRSPDPGGPGHEPRPAH